MKSFFIAALFLSLISCSKTLETSSATELTEDLSRPVPISKPCTISTIVYSNGLSSHTVVFNYNATGDPISALRDFVSLGSPALSFIYKDGRLSEYIGNYASSNAYEFWSKYVYNTANVIVQDTTWIFGDLSDPTNSYERHITDYTYDKAGRIKCTHLEYNDAIKSFRTDEYTYNSSGNISQVTTTTDYSGTSTVQVGPYDNKTSISRTNKIWMFLNRDYSVNNSFIADQYFTTYPSKTSGEASKQFIYLADLSTATITYNCRSDKKN